ncbi:hypothetical protein D030_4588 [Vibrio parahaemolyticus AQ3810]|nr:hypothetical protein D030_4588 [Vibrio parahaemolyticus AQ3810]
MFTKINVADAYFLKAEFFSPNFDLLCELFVVHVLSPR